MGENIVEFGSEGARLIAAERLRQVQEEGWKPSHDDDHGAGELAGAAVAYVQHATFGKSVQWIFHSIRMAVGAKVVQAVRADPRSC